MVMVHNGDTFSLAYRDRLVKRAAQQNPAALAASYGDDLHMATGTLLPGSKVARLLSERSVAGCWAAVCVRDSLVLGCPSVGVSELMEYLIEHPGSWIDKHMGVYCLR